MTISSTTNRVSYTGNGVTTAFAFGYKFLANADLDVYQEGTLKTITTHYTVTGAGDDAGGTVTFLVAPANNDEIVIVRNPDITQEMDLVENDPLPAETVEGAFDKITIIAQRLDDRLDRSVVLSDSAVGTVDLTLPTPVANKGLRWNATADGLENTTDDIDDLATDAAASAAAASASASAASTSAGTASTAASNAQTAETNAETAEANAEAAASAVGTQFTFDSSTSMADPGTGDFRFNNATVGSVTAIAFSALTSESGNADVSSFLATWADSSNTTVKGHLVFKKSGTPATFAVFSISVITDNSAWLEATVSHVASNGSWSAADVAYCAFSRTGNKGSDGVGAGDFMADGSVPMTGNIVFEGTTADAYETTFAITDPTADRTITFPDASGTAKLSGVETIWIPAVAMIARTTNGAAAGTTETTTNKVMVKTLDFDQSTDEFAQFQIRMPKSWNEGTVTATFLWSSNVAGTNAVVWGLQGVSLSDDDALDTAFGTAQTVTDAQTAQGDLMQTAETSAITIAGTPAAGDWVCFQAYRDADAGGDTLAGDARLHGVTLFYTSDATNDA